VSGDIPARGQIPALTGVRALAAFLVFFHHYPTRFLEVGSLLLWKELHIGVSLFFVLSGFVITWRYDRRGPRTESFLRGYFVNRFARIYPLYFFLVVPTMILGGARSLRAWLMNLTLFTSFEAGIPQAWSLRVEECFYLAAPLVFLLWRRHPALPLPVAAAVLVALYPVSKMPWTFDVIGPPRYLLLYSFFGRFFEFYVGIWLAKRVAKAEAAGPPRARFPLFTLGGIAGIAAVVVALAALRVTPRGTYEYGLYHPAGVVLNNLVLPLLTGAFYWGLIREASLLRRILSTRVADLLGRSSYAFYLVHLGLFGNVLGYLLGITALLESVGARFVFVTMLSILLYAGIESPANRFLRRRFGSA
jgi:peptidoglycan/LPS O-acetylase OafA/YrhL